MRGTDAIEGSFLGMFQVTGKIAIELRFQNAITIMDAELQVI